MSHTEYNESPDQWSVAREILVAAAAVLGISAGFAAIVAIPALIALAG